MILTVVKSESEICLRVTTGPEGETLMDMSGSQDLDITKIIESFKTDSVADKKVMLKLCRCRCEADVLGAAEKLGIPASYVTLPFEKEETEEVPKPKVEASVKPAKTRMKWGRCAYCGDEVEMLGIPGFMICKTCAQIELGRSREQNKESK